MVSPSWQHGVLSLLAPRRPWWPKSRPLDDAEGGPGATRLLQKMCISLKVEYQTSMFSPRIRLNIGYDSPKFKNWTCNNFTNTYQYLSMIILVTFL